MSHQLNHGHVEQTLAKYEFLMMAWIVNEGFQPEKNGRAMLGIRPKYGD